MLKKWSAVVVAVLALSIPAWASQKLSIDRGHSSVGFSIRHLVSNVKGRFTDFSGEINFDSSKVENSSVNVVIKSASINTDNEKRDNHLKSGDFFEVEKNPEITFQSKKVTKEGEKLLLHGTLLMHGVTKEVSFPFQILATAKGPNGTLMAGFEAELTLNRKDFGINWNRTLDQGSVLLGDNVKISLALETREMVEPPPAQAEEKK